MIPIGYLYKKISFRPDWLLAEDIVDIYSVSSCISPSFLDYTSFWLHNGYWLFNSPEVMERLASQNQIHLEAMTLFYFEVYENEFDEYDRLWSPIRPTESFDIDVKVPHEKKLHGFDVVTFSCGTTPECSPLSCNSLAAQITVNSHCLFDSLVEAQEALEQGKFNESEEGPFRILAVYSVQTH